MAKTQIEIVLAAMERQKWDPSILSNARWLAMNLFTVGFGMAFVPFYVTQVGSPTTGIWIVGASVLGCLLGAVGCQLDLNRCVDSSDRFLATSHLVRGGVAAVFLGAVWGSVAVWMIKADSLGDYPIAGFRSGPVVLMALHAALSIAVGSSIGKGGCECANYVPDVQHLTLSTRVIPVLVTGTHPTANAGASGGMDRGNKPREDNSGCGPLDAVLYCMTVHCVVIEALAFRSARDLLPLRKIGWDESACK